MTGAARIKAKAGAQQADWLSLVEPRGQWLTLPVLRQAFPSGLSPLPADTRRQVRERAIALDPRDPSSSTDWIEWLLRDLLGWGDKLRAGPQVPDQLRFTVPEHGVSLRPEYALLDSNGAARLLVERYAPGTQLEARIPGDRWAASPIDRAMLLCRALAVPLALVTNGQHFTLVYAPIDKTGGHATWDTALFAEGAEASLLSAFVDLLGAQSFFARAADSQLEALLARSAEAQAELTTSLGLQVRRAVELMVASISRANLEAGGHELRGISPHRVYEAASTVVMRLVFLLYAEERHLLPLGEQVYDDNYAICTLREQLRAESDMAGDEPLELRSDAWQRILATSRAVYGGVSHDRLRMPAYHGSLFDPDRFPFLEGRTNDQPWATHPARPIRVDDLTIREILTALQIITTSHGGVTEARRLSFRALDVEQIGHVYEGLLDHSALRAESVVIGLVGKAGGETEITLDDLEHAATQSEQSLTNLLMEKTGRTVTQIKKLLTAKIDERQRRGLLTACDNDAALVERLEPYVSLIRDDLRGLPTVFTPGTVYVTETSHRRDTGTEYTTRELADEIVKYTLEPLVYSPGPQDGAEPEHWKLKSPEEILALTVCDPAVGSGAILVAACRYLADRLLEARLAREEVPDGYIYDPSVPAEQDELLVQARRDVADRCLFGVDRDPMAVEMAKLSLWLTTLSKERPFTFVDHAVQSGDSLLGITSIDQLYAFHLDPARGKEINENLLVDLNAAIKPMVDAALDARRQLEGLPATTVRDLERKAELNQQATDGLREASIVADLIVGAALASEGRDPRFEQSLQVVQESVAAALNARGNDRADLIATLRERGQALLNQGRPAGAPMRQPLHWPLAFPEVFASGGFSALVGNPPFLGGKRISRPNGVDVREYLVRWLAAGRKGNADLVAYFFLRAACLAQNFGLLATNTLAQGDTREVGLDALMRDGFTIYRAVKSRPWPGSATLEVAQVWATGSVWRGAFYLGGECVPFITAQLQSESRVTGMPERLMANKQIAFIGSLVNGAGFILEPDEASRILTQEPLLRKVVRPYLNGQDVNGRADSSPSRSIIDCSGLTLPEVRAMTPIASILEARVLPTRAKLPNSKARVRDNWWLFEYEARELYAKLSSMDYCYVLSRVSKTVQPQRVATGPVFSEQVVVFASGDLALYAALCSQFHWLWTIKYASSMRKDPRYTPSDVFETFPLPDFTERMREMGGRLDVVRRDLQSEWNLGLTRLYNRIHDPEDRDPGVQLLRELHRAVDLAVRDTYGWSDLDLEHGFNTTSQGVRWTFSEAVQREVLDRLLDLNHTRHTEEVASSASAPKKIAGLGKKKPVDDDAQMTLEMP